MLHKSFCSLKHTRTLCRKSYFGVSPLLFSYVGTIRRTINSTITCQNVRSLSSKNEGREKHIKVVFLGWRGDGGGGMN